MKNKIILTLVFILLCCFNHQSWNGKCRAEENLRLLWSAKGSLKGFHKDMFLGNICIDDKQYQSRYNLYKLSNCDQVWGNGTNDFTNDAETLSELCDDNTNFSSENSIMNSIIVQSYMKDNQYYTRGYDINTGMKKWTREGGSFFAYKGKYAYKLKNGKLLTIDIDTGKTISEKDIPQKYLGKTVGNPALCIEDKLIFVSDPLYDSFSACVFDLNLQKFIWRFKGFNCDFNYDIGYQWFPYKTIQYYDGFFYVIDFDCNKKSFNEETRSLFKVDARTGKYVQKYDIDGNFKIENGVLYYVRCFWTDAFNKNSLIAVDLKNNTKLWEKELQLNYAQLNFTGNYLLVSGEWERVRKSIFLKKKSGSTDKEYLLNHNFSSVLINGGYIVYFSKSSVIDGRNIFCYKLPDKFIDSIKSERKGLILHVIRVILSKIFRFL